MGTRDPASARLRMVLGALADSVGAQFAALFRPHAGGLHLVEHADIDQSALTFTHAAWARRRADLLDARVQRMGRAVIWPLFDGRELAGLLYLDNAPAGFPDEEALAFAADIVGRLRRMKAPSGPVSNYLAAGLSLEEAVRESERDQIAIALQLHQGKVRPAARALGITRDTLYRRADRLEIDLSAFRRKATK